EVTWSKWQSSRCNCSFRRWIRQVEWATAGSIMAVQRSADATKEVHAGVQDLSGQAGQRARLLDPRGGEEPRCRCQLRPRLGRQVRDRGSGPGAQRRRSDGGGAAAVAQGERAAADGA